MEILYKVFENSDIQSVLLFWRNLDGICLHTNGEETYEGLSLYLQRNPGFCFVALCGDEIVGAILCGHDGRRGYVHHLGVQPDYRQNGIAHHLLQLAEEQLHKAGIKKEALFVLRENKSAQQFYEHNGWKEESIIKTYCRIIPQERT